ncbi:MAG: L-seryl-tRNA(Sec) selenium transferase [Lachnospiraceae bacterium]|nr:L-seryl-tRNA(Sec) selenium transferase [Lachnospiraceae bacterium]
MSKELLKKLPKMDQLLSDEKVILEIEKGNRVMMTDALRKSLDYFRNEILSGNMTEEVLKEYIIGKAFFIFEDDMEMNLKPVINATGTILHTNLGRSRLSKAACEAVYNISSSYSNLEYDIEKGERGERYDAVTDIILKLTGAESALVVNNNAAAVLLILSALAKDKDVIVSRGEQVEIGGKFRVPDIMEQSGSRLVEVGTTNKTHLSDYEDKINENSVLLKVHTSNFKLIGFTEEVELKELSKLSKKHGIPLVYDLGSGAMIDFEAYGIYGEPCVRKSVEDDPDVICFSGDKLLGGPQAGIIIGRKKYIDIMKKHPLTRAFRIDKMTLAALEATLKEYIDEKNAIKNIPILSRILANKSELHERAKRLYEIIALKSPELNLSIEEDKGQIGGGSMPGLTIDTAVISINHAILSPNEIERRLRHFEKPIICRISRESVILDLLTIDDEDFDYIADCIMKMNQDVK